MIKKIKKIMRAVTFVVIGVVLTPVVIVFALTASTLTILYWLLVEWVKK